MMMYYIKDNFYFDIDRQNQLRITGPQNHLLLGITFPSHITAIIESFEIEKNQLVITLQLSSKELETAIPIVCDIRTIRSFTEGKRPTPTFDQLVQLRVDEVLPQIVRRISHGDHYTYKFITAYTDERGKKRRFGTKLYIPSTYKNSLTDMRLKVSASENIKIRIKTISNVRAPKQLKTGIFIHNETKLKDQALAHIYVKAGDDIEHLIRSQKTSSFEYGTIFPRDWIESADLGRNDLLQEIVDYMYLQAMKNISETGEGWHEEIVGAYRTKVSWGNFVDRKMIDIEPRYILGMNTLSKSFILKRENKHKLQLVAHYILRNAEEKELITFKRIGASDNYYRVGNWRDSERAFPGQRSPLAPYDVNCVFYPLALKIIKRYKDYFKIKDLHWLDHLISKWDHHKQKFRLYHPYGIIGYALALHGSKNKPLPIAHLDESYDLFYGDPSLEEVYAFATKITDSDFFYTPVGPVLVANDEEDLSQGDYHGKVIWPKQAAFAIAGLTRQYKKGIEENYSENILKVIKKAVLAISEACFAGWKDLNAIPELYYYDTRTKKAHFFTDQKDFNGQMSMIQLWSSVGARRIINDYMFFRKDNS